MRLFFSQSFQSFCDQLQDTVTDCFFNFPSLRASPAAGLPFVLNHWKFRLSMSHMFTARRNEKPRKAIKLGRIEDMDGDWGGKQKPERYTNNRVHNLLWSSIWLRFKSALMDDPHWRPPVDYKVHKWGAEAWIFRANFQLDLNWFSFFYATS